MKRFIRILSLCIVIVFAVCLTVVPSSALSFDCDVQQYSDTLLMVNLDTDMEVFAKEADVKRDPTSLTKIMDYIIVAEHYDDFDTRIEIKQNLIDRVYDLDMTCSGVDNYVGSSLSVTDLLYAMMLPAGQDGTMVLADAVGEGDLNKFVDLMNEKAKELGCEDTHFTDPFGNHNEDQYTTAHDLYKITKFAMGLPMFSKICGSTTYYADDSDEAEPFITTNWLIDSARGGEYNYVYATGIKNATSQQAGRCLVATAVCDGYAYMCVCLHAPYDENSDENDQWCMIEAADMFRWAFLGLAFQTPATKDTPVCEQAVDHAWDTKSILLTPEYDLNVILPYNYSEGDVKIVPDNTDPVSAPIKKGNVVTTITVYYRDEPFRSINLVSSQDVGVSPILFFTDTVGGILSSPWFLIAVGLIVVIFIVYVSVSSSYAKKRRDRRSK